MIKRRLFISNIMMLEKMFSVFYRSSKSGSNTGQGIGLGLAISAKITTSGRRDQILESA